MEIASPVLPDFDYIRANSPEEVTELLLEYRHEARLFMGGTDVLVRMRDGAMAPQVMIDVKHLPGLTSIYFNEDSGLQIGAAVNMNALTAHPHVIEHYPLLVEAINTVASYPLRTRATLGGNLCNASPAADTAPAALVLDATLVIWGSNGERTVSANEFFVGPGATVLQPGEFVTRVDFPVPPDGYVGRYIKLGRNASGDLAIVGVAVIGYPDETAKSGYRFRMALASVAPTPIRVLKAEAILAENTINADTIEQAAQSAQNTARPIDDLRASARYRKAMVRNLTRRALQDVWANLGE